MNSSQLLTQLDQVKQTAMDFIKNKIIENDDKEIIFKNPASVETKWGSMYVYSVLLIDDKIFVKNRKKEVCHLSDFHLVGIVEIMGKVEAE